MTSVTLDRILDRALGGHINLGPVTIFGRNAMHWAVNIRTHRWGWVCFRLPFFCYGAWWPLYLYASPNGTPWAATFYVGGGRWDRDRMLAPIRRARFGHNFDSDRHYEELQKINESAVTRKPEHE